MGSPGMARTYFPPPPAAHWLLAGIALVIAPHASHLPLWLDTVLGTMLAWRWAAAAGRLPLPGKWVLALLLVGSAAGILLQYRTLFGRDAGVAMLTLMLALKLLEMRSYRDAMLTVFLGYFLVITNFFYTQSIPLAVYLFAVALMLTGALVALNHPSAAGRWRQTLKLSAQLLLQAVPVMLLLFLLFPRPGGPLWGMPSDAFSAKTGLSETMAPGSISNLVQSDAIAFRAEFAGAPPLQSSLYWRALVLEDFDGRTWSLARGTYVPEPLIKTSGTPFVYNLTIEPHNKPWVFALEIPDPLALPKDTYLLPSLQLLARKPLQRRTRYTLTSYIDHQIGNDIAPENLRRTRFLPRGVNPQARELAQRMRSESANDAEVVTRALQLFREQAYSYTLTPPLLGQNSVDDFLFKTRSGFCEHYAGAFTFLMRAAGVPARIVTGYQGGEYNPVGNYLIVRQSDAHAWSEVWLEGRGWVRVDPTAAVASNRIESGIASALPEGEPLPFFVRTDMAWLKQMRQSWDAVNHYWDQWVLGFDQEQQIGLFIRMGVGIVSWRQLAWGLGIGLALLLGIIAVFTFWPERKAAPDRVQALYLRFCRKLEKAGVPRMPTEGPLDFAQRAALLRPELAASVDTVARLYVRLRYGRTPSGENLNELAALVRRFRA
jgi:transglutaminase-like putative cysteine protease